MEAVIGIASFVLGTATVATVLIVTALLFCHAVQWWTLDNADASLCRETLESIRHRPHEWTGRSGNPYIPRDFHYRIRHLNGAELWVGSGMTFLSFVEPSEIHISLRWKIPMWLAYRKNRRRMDSKRNPLDSWNANTKTGDNPC